ncbi:MAG: hypothetical protein JNL90_20040 [Planctomycetes bacterium]|nr:hypothetical protein [Planctomycetota bacterium]
MASGGQSSGGARLVAAALLLALVAGIAWRWIDSEPRLDAMKHPDGAAGATADDATRDSAAPATVERTAAPANPSGAREPREASDTPIDRAPIREEGTVAAPQRERIEVTGALVDEHARPLDERALFAAAAGTLPRVWLVQRGERLAEFGRNPDGFLRTSLLAPPDRSGLEAELSLGARRFATFLEESLSTPFTLRVDLSALAVEGSAATIVVRPNPPHDTDDRAGVVLWQGATRRALWLDEAGRARFTALDAGRWRGVVRVAGERPAEFALELAERDDREVLVQLQPGFRIVGSAAWDGIEASLPRAVASVTRIAAAAGATAAAVASVGDEAEPPLLDGGFAPLGGDGSFALGPLPAGAWRLQIVRTDGAIAVLHEVVVELGGRDVERLELRIAPQRPPTRIVRLLLEWPAEAPRALNEQIIVPRLLQATFRGPGDTVVGHGFADPRSRTPPELELPQGAVALELEWRDSVDGLLLDSGVAPTRVLLPRVVQEGRTQDLRVELAAAPRD